MLTRPGCEPGPERMRRLSGNPRQLRKAMLGIIVFVGVISFGGVSVGFLSLGGLSAGLLTLGPAAVDWRAIGAVAVGQAGLGSLALGRWAYAGPGVALGRDLTSGDQKGSLLG